MIRFLLSLLAFVSGLALPGAAEARAFGPSGTEIGATAQVRAEAQVVVAHAATLLAFHPVPRLRLARAIPAFRAIMARPAPTVRIGSDRARA